MVNELNAKFLNLLGNSKNNNGSLNSLGCKEQKGKLDSSQINDGDFERIMNGKIFFKFLFFIQKYFF